jgi:hypothetical protein
MNERISRVVDETIAALFQDRKYGPHWQEIELVTQAFQYAQDHYLIYVFRGKAPSGAGAVKE